MRARLNPFAPPFPADLQQQAKIDRHNDAILRQTYGYQVGRLPLDEYDMLVETTRELYKSASGKKDPIGDWFDTNGFKEK